ncbi:MAG TPA: adenosine deaminase [Paracoccaceae bacterium]|nr:adenosine deaminase [Paracoccaceae bacterium]
MTDWRAQPKVELHLHLEGAAPPAFIRAEAARKGVDLSAIFNADGSYRWRDFGEFLKVYEAASSVLTGPDEYWRLAEAVMRASREDGVIYAEAFLAPQLIGEGDEGAWAEHFAAIREGAAAVAGIEARFIAICVRHRGAAAADWAARVAARTEGLAGFGMAGDERFGEPADYARAFAIARDAGLPVTAHAGEICGAESVRGALDHLKVGRIGHGVRAVEDPELVRRLAEEGVVLEVNPGSNLALGLYPGWAAHPIAALDAAGVAVTVSTDDPPYFHTSLPHEYACLHEAFGWGAGDFARLNRIAMRAAFCDEATRAAMLARLEAES